MVGCVLTGHGSFAEGVGDAVSMVGGPQKDFEIVTFREEETYTFPERLGRAIHSLLDSCGQVVVFCDLLGGTPFNQSMVVAAKTPGVEVVTGANLPMMLECLLTRDDASTAADVVETALSAGQGGIDHRCLEIDTEGDSANDDEDGI